MECVLSKPQSFCQDKAKPDGAQRVEKARGSWRCSTSVGCTNPPWNVETKVLPTAVPVLHDIFLTMGDYDSIEFEQTPPSQRVLEIV